MSSEMAVVEFDISVYLKIKKKYFILEIPG